MKKIFIIGLVFLFFLNLLSSQNTYTSLNLKKIPGSVKDNAESIICLYDNDLVLDTIFFTNLDKGPIETYFIFDTTELSIIDAHMYLHYKKNEDGKWRSINFFPLKFNNMKYVSVKTTKNTKPDIIYKLTGIKDIFRAEIQKYGDVPIWEKIDFDEVQRSSKAAVGGTKENEEWQKRIKDPVYFEENKKQFIERQKK